MNNIGDQVSYKQLLARHNAIEIPKIQRDYAQGREDQSEIRTQFLSELKAALTQLPRTPFNLDFVYGSVECRPKSGSFFAPLDGQQRLTTLLLLHWYLAWADQRWDEFVALFAYENHSRFRYDVRPTSDELFHRLVSYCPDCRPSALAKISDWVKDQEWYFLHWKLDPTIQSTLEMLDAIHRHFAPESDLGVGLFAALVDDVNPGITFQLLDLTDFGLSDDLYIKMNARGKALTPFETFKARYGQKLEEQCRDGIFAGQTEVIDDQPVSIATFVASRMDNAWTDFFWDHNQRRLVAGSVAGDSSMMNLLRVIAAITRPPEDARYLEHIEMLRDKSKTLSFAAYESEGWLDEDFTRTMITLLEQWSAKGRSLSRLPKASWQFNEQAIFDKLTAEATSLFAHEVVLFLGYAIFLRAYASVFDTVQFHEWMRVVHNLAVNSDIDRNDRLQNPAKALRELLPYAPEILEHLAQRTTKLSGFTEQQLSEEKLKASLIIAHAGWRSRINRAEEHGYFAGQIQHLLDFSGATAESEARRPQEWGEAAHLQIQERFDFYLARAVAMFDPTGLKPTPDRLWQRALLSIGDCLIGVGKSGERWSFPIDAKTEPNSWKRFLRGGEISGKRQYLQTLWDKLTLTGPIEDELRAIIHSARDLAPWIEALVRTPLPQGYCGNDIICFWSDDPTEYEAKVFLLSGKTMGSDHAELFTFCLFHGWMAAPETRNQLAPLVVGHYKAVWGKEAQPHISLIWQRSGQLVEFRVEYPFNSYRIHVSSAALDGIPSVRASLLSKASFVEENGSLAKVSSRDTIEADLQAVAVLLRAVEGAPIV